MDRYLPIKINSHDYMIDLCGYTWSNSGLPVSKMVDENQHIHMMWFRLHICELAKTTGWIDVRITSEYLFMTGKKIVVEFMGKTYHPGDNDFELAKLHNALETETALARLGAR